MESLKEVRCPCGMLLLRTSSAVVSGEKLCSKCRKRIHFDVRGNEVLVQEAEAEKKAKEDKPVLLKDLKCLTPLDNSPEQ